MIRRRFVNWLSCGIKPPLLTRTRTALHSCGNCFSKDGPNGKPSPARLHCDSSALPLGNGGSRSAGRKMSELLQEGMLEPGSLPTSVPGLHDLKLTECLSLPSGSKRSKTA